MIIPKNKSVFGKKLPRIVNTPERKDIVLVKSMICTRFISRSKNLLDYLDRLTENDLPHRKRIKYKRKIVKLVKELGADFVEMRKAEAKLYEYDEMQRLMYFKRK